jgi:hypothetical protein
MGFREKRFFVVVPEIENSVGWDDQGEFSGGAMVSGSFIKGKSNNAKKCVLLRREEATCAFV